MSWQDGLKIHFTPDPSQGSAPAVRGLYSGASLPLSLEFLCWEIENLKLSGEFKDGFWRQSSVPAEELFNISASQVFILMKYRRFPSGYCPSRD